MVAHDFAVVYLDDKFIGSYNRTVDRQIFTANCKGSCRLLILVEAMGHINFDHSMEKDKKGLISISQPHAPLLWNMYKTQHRQGHPSLEEPWGN